MSRSQAYYRALTAYRAVTASRRDCAGDLRTMMDAEGEGRMTVSRAVCTVDESWINAIEAGLVHIEKAIREERQFIHSNGEVIPIEKVKHVSKDSVRHLARHAELITHRDEGEDLTPDKLYTVERLSDYAVYENRFLYMLLCYLRDFVTLRYQRILELTNRYDGTLSTEREVLTFNRRLRVRVELEETAADDPYLRAHNPARELIDRMDLILKTVLTFLATPLMESAGKAAMLKPPITKTNVLKMDNNFKGAVALYDFIIAYEGDGYTVTEEVQELDPFSEECAEDMAEAHLLLSHLTYRYSLGLTPELRSVYELEEDNARRAELKLQAEQLESLRRRLEQSGEPPETYILLLEKQARALQNQVSRGEAIAEELAAAEARGRELQESLRRADARVEGIDQEIAAIGEEHANALREAEADKHKALAAAEEAYAADRHRQQTESLDRDRAYEAEIAIREGRLTEKQAELDRMTAAYEALTEKNRLLTAQNRALRAMREGIPPEEAEAMTDEAGFDELERELEAFVKFYKSQWKQTKRRIRRDLLTAAGVKEQAKERKRGRIRRGGKNS